jgi:hypothetical protein
MHSALSIGLWFLGGWIVSVGFFYVLKNHVNVDKGVCLPDSREALTSQILHGFEHNFSNVHGECLFSRGYTESKAKFTKLAQEAGAELMDYPVKSLKLMLSFEETLKRCFFTSPEHTGWKPTLAVLLNWLL